MRYTALFIGFFLIFVPSLAFAQAQTLSCSTQGYTVVYVNGVFGNLDKAKADVTQLRETYKLEKNSLNFKNESVDFEVGFNPSENAGIDDALKSLRQLKQGQTVGYNEDHDADVILSNMFSEVKTQKILLVGHSQGAFYTNEIYKYLIDSGVPVSAISVYNIDTPSNYTSGGGIYLTSSNDTVINGIRNDVSTNPGLYGTNQPLTANINISLQSGDDTGHLFVSTYLNGAPQQIVSDIQTALGKLKSSPMPNLAGGCFNPPSTSVLNSATVSFKDYGASTIQGMYVVGAGTINGSIAAVKSGYQASISFLSGITNVAIGALQFVADAVTLSANRPTDAQATQKTETIANKLYGSSLDGLSAQDKKDLLGSSQGGAVALALAAPKAPSPAGVVLGTSTEQSAPTPPTSSNLFPQSSNGPIVGGGGPAPLAPVAAIVVETPPTQDDETSSTQDSEASSTPPVEDASSTPPTPPAPAAPTGAPFTDNFDGYTDDQALSAWSVWANTNGYIRMPADTGTADPFLGGVTLDGTPYVDTTYTGTSDCHSGSCIIGRSIIGGLGGGGQSSAMYRESGVAQDSGAFTIWARSRTGWRPASAQVGLCVGINLGCLSPNVMGLGVLGADNDNTWHQYYLAWRQGNASVEICVLKDNTNAGGCSWQTTATALGTQFDGIFLRIETADQSLGDQVWFDDIEEAPAQ